VTESERQKAFEREQRRLLRAQIELLRNTQAEIERLMTRAIADVRAILAGQPTDYQQWHLPQVQAEISRALEVFRAQATGAVSGAADRAWDGGRDLIDKPLAAAGLHVAGVAPLLSQVQLRALKSFMTDRIRDVSAEAINRVNAQLGLVTIGARTPFEATKAVAVTLEDNSLARATTIVRTELGRAFSVASQARMDEAAKVVKLDKVWRRSGKPHQRLGHAIADGQRVAHDEPFEIIAKTGEIVKLMYPRDPKGPPGETINCGCVAIPKVRGWKTTTADQAPFTERELAGNQELRAVAAARSRK
jgi:hypothetical protein